jgi:hypothetical protein
VYCDVDACMTREFTVPITSVVEGLMWDLIRSKGKYLSSLGGIEVKQVKEVSTLPSQMVA